MTPLKPNAIYQNLKQFYPLKLDTIFRNLNFYHHSIQALTLLERYFPGWAEQPHPDNMNWLVLMEHFFRCVGKAGWFDVDWSMLTFLEQILYEYPVEGFEGMDEEEAQEGREALRSLELAIEKIPIQCFGLSPFGWPRDIGDHPPLALLRGLLGPRLTETDTEPLIGGVPWNSESKKTAWLRLYSMDTASFPEPLCWLPQMAEYACNQTGNVLLDTVPQPENLRGRWFRWDNPDDIAFLRRQWAEAELFMDRVDTFIEWTDTKENLDLIRALVTGQPKKSKKAGVVAIPCAVPL